MSSSLLLLESVFAVSDHISLRPKSIAAAKFHQRPSFRTTRPNRLLQRALLTNKVYGPYTGSNPLIPSLRPQRMYAIKDNSSVVSCTLDMTAGQSEDPKKLNMDHTIGEVRKIWRSLPQPVKIFPWIKALENFLELIFGLVYAVAKYLSVPLLAISSLSEMSYCAHERKMLLIPIPVLAGVAVAGSLRDTMLDLYPQLKEREYPLHLVVIAAFFILLRLPGPYYPYWGRILIPHFANGGLWTTLWFAFLWSRRPREDSPTILLQASIIDQKSDQSSNVSV